MKKIEKFLKGEREKVAVDLVKGTKCKNLCNCEYEKKINSVVVKQDLKAIECVVKEDLDKGEEISTNAVKKFLKQYKKFYREMFRKTLRNHRLLRVFEDYVY